MHAYISIIFFYEIMLLSICNSLADAHVCIIIGPVNCLDFPATNNLAKVVKICNDGLAFCRGEFYLYVLNHYT